MCDSRKCTHSKNVLVELYHTQKKTSPVFVKKSLILSDFCSQKCLVKLQKQKQQSFKLLKQLLRLKQYRVRMDRVPFDRIILKPSYTD
jgi:hypothetical protein